MSSLIAIVLALAMVGIFAIARALVRAGARGLEALRSPGRRILELERRIELLEAGRRDNVVAFTPRKGKP